MDATQKENKSAKISCEIWYQARVLQTREGRPTMPCRNSIKVLLYQQPAPQKITSRQGFWGEELSTAF